MLDSVLPVYSVIHKSMEQTPRHLDKSYTASATIALTHIPKGYMYSTFFDESYLWHLCYPSCSVTPHYHLIITHYHFILKFTLLHCFSGVVLTQYSQYEVQRDSCYALCTQSALHKCYQWLFADLQVLVIISLGPRLPHTRIIIIISQDQN